jgi:ATP-binding cassette, subfamily B, multidrug efflux pump
MQSTKPSRSRPKFGPGSHGATIESAENIRGTIARMAAYLRPYTGQLFAVMFLVILGTALRLAAPILLGRAVDLYIVPRDLAGLGRLSLSILGIFILSSLAAAGYGVLMVGIAQTLIRELRGQLFDHLQRLSMQYHDTHDSGDIMSRITNDTDVISNVLSNGLIQLVSNILTLAGILIVMVLLNWQLAIGTVLILPVMVFVTGTVARHARHTFRELQASLGRLNALAEETIAGERVIQAFARSGEAVEQYEIANRINRDAGIRAEVITATLMPMFGVMSSLTVATIAGLGGWLAIRGWVTVGVIVTFVIYTYQFFQPLRMLAQLYNQLQSAVAGAERIFRVLDEVPKVKDSLNAAPLPPLEGDVRFEHVCFAYEPGSPVLEDISLHATPGQTVALVGPTGAGKTTIISLLSRFYDVQQGSILVDRHDIRTITQASLRRQLGIVLQDTFLFSDTVIENIRYGRHDADDDEVIAAAELANADQFICRLPEGYHTRLSEQGSNLSQGQRQLLSIARAVLADPRILILDEATSSVDTRTEMHIQEALLRLMHGRTAFVIAHRLSTIRSADQVLVVNDGTIIERGTHESLLDQGGFYHNLYTSQFRHAQELAN